MLTELFSDLEARRRRCDAECWAIAHKLAAGKKVAPAAVERLLADTGETPADMRATVELLQQRRQWFDTASAAALEQDRTAAKERIAAEDRKSTAAEQAHADATGPLNARLDAIRARQTCGTGAAADQPSNAARSPCFAPSDTVAGRWFPGQDGAPCRRFRAIKSASWARCTKGASARGVE